MTVQMREPTLQEMLADPIIVTLMKADKVDRSALEASLMALARRNAPPLVPEASHGDVMTMLRGLCRPGGKAYCPA